MSPLPKVIALTSVAGAAIADAALFVVTALQSTPTPSVGDIGVASGAGAATTLAILWFWKGTVDKRIDKLDDGKADKASVADMKVRIDSIHDDVKWLVRRKQEEHE